VRDIGGRVAARYEAQRGARAVMLDLRSLPAGVYFIELAGEPATRQRIVKID
jgi:hypothetical protein